MRHRNGSAVVPLTVLVSCMSATMAAATPVSLFGESSAGGHYFAIGLNGDQSGTIIMLDNPPTSSIVLDLTNPPAQPLPDEVITGAYCGGFTCSIRVDYNASLVLTTPA